MKRLQSIDVDLMHVVKVLSKKQNDSLFLKIAEALLLLKCDLSLTALKSD